MSVSVSLSAQNRVGAGCQVYAYSHERPLPLSLPALGPAASFEKQAFELPDVADSLPHATFGVLNGLGAFMCQPGAKDLQFRFARDEDMQAVLADDGARILKHAFLLETLSQLRYGGPVDDYHMDIRSGAGRKAVAVEPPVDRVPEKPLPKLPTRLPVADLPETPPLLCGTEPQPVPQPEPPLVLPPNPPAAPPGSQHGHQGRPDPHSAGHSPLPMRETSGNPHR